MAFLRALGDLIKLLFLMEKAEDIVVTQVETVKFKDKEEKADETGDTSEVESLFRGVPSDAGVRDGKTP